LGRLLQLTARYARSFSALRLSKRERSTLAAALNDLSTCELPAASDFESSMPGTPGIWSRRLGSGLWLLYSFDDRTVTIRNLIRSPE
jgi:hypothetical protein